MAHDTITLIENAFADMVLGGGVSLREADVIDNYGDDDDRAAARARDELLDWRRIPDADIAAFHSVLHFMDDAGLRFHLPAYMRFTLRHQKDLCSRSLGSAPSRLCDPEVIRRLRASLTDLQVRAIVAFLDDLIAFEEKDASETWVLARRTWRGDPVAAAALDAVDRERQAAFETFMTALHRAPNKSAFATDLSAIGSVAVAAVVCSGLATGIYLRHRHQGPWWVMTVGCIGVGFLAVLMKVWRHFRSRGPQELTD